MGVIKKQGIQNSIITYIGVLIGAVNVIFIQPKLLSPEELGLTRILFDFSYMISLLIPLGLPHMITKFYPFYKDDSKKHNGFAGFILGVFFIGFVIASVFLLTCKPFIVQHYVEKAKLFVDFFYVIIPFTFIVSAITITTAYCQALFKSTLPSFLNDIFVRLGMIAITVLYFNKLISFEVYVYAFIGIYAVELLVLIVYLLKTERISFQLDKTLRKKYSVRFMLKFGLVLCAASFASIALRKVDVIFLGTSSLGLVAVYTTAVFIASFIEVPLGALERISHAKIADFFSRDSMHEVNKAYSDSVKYLLIIGGLLFIGINACTKYVYQIGGLPKEYIECLDVVYIVSFAALVNVSTGINSALMFYSKYFGAATIILVSVLIITVLLNILLIPMYGIYGAAAASAFGSIIYNGVKFGFIYKKFGFQPYTIKSLVVVSATILCATIAIYVPEISNYPIINLIYKGSVGCLLYIGVVYKFQVSPELFEMIVPKSFRKKK